RARRAGPVRRGRRRRLRARPRRRCRRAYWTHGRGSRGGDPCGAERPRRRFAADMTEPPALSRPAWVAVDLDAIRGNVRALVSAAAPAALLATVKADAYGHGAVPVARGAVEAGAAFLGVGFVDEGIELREAGIDTPILLLSEPPPVAVAAVVAYGLTPLVYTVNGIDALAKAVVDADAAPHAVHLK